MMNERILNNAEWAELLRKNYEELVEEAINAGLDAIENKNLRYIVQIDEAGDISTWYDMARGDSILEDVLNGRAMEVFNICYQSFAVEPEDGETQEQANISYIQEVESSSYESILDEIIIALESMQQ